MMTKRIPLLAVATLCSMTIEASGQAAKNLIGVPRIGLAAGMNVATIAGSDVTGAKNRTGFNGGIYVAIPVTPVFEIQPELLYTGKGLKSNDNGATGEVRLSYIEVPVLARWNIPTSSSVTPHLYLGPSFAVKTGCTVAATFQGANVSADCDESGGSSISSVDAGILGGAGLSFAVGSQRATIGARYELGLKNVASDANGKNRVFSMLASFEIPLGSR